MQKRALLPLAKSEGGLAALPSLTTASRLLGAQVQVVGLLVPERRARQHFR